MSTFDPAKLMPYQQRVFKMLLTMPEDHKVEVLTIRGRYRIVAMPKDGSYQPKGFDGEKWGWLYPQSKSVPDEQTGLKGDIFVD